MKIVKAVTMLLLWGLAASVHAGVADKVKFESKDVKTSYGEARSTSSAVVRVNNRVEVVGEKRTEISGGYKLNGTGAPIQGDNRGSSTNTVYGVGIRYSF